MINSAAYSRHGSQSPQSPVILSVPHAGRAYPAGCAHLLRVPLERLLPLEDRYADGMAAMCIAQGITAFIAQVPRLWIDLNRTEHEIDPNMIMPQPLTAPFMTHKVRSGLGLVPARLGGVGEIWRTRLSHDDLNERIVRVYRPYHAALGAALAAARACFGWAVLIDLHSMPPLKGADAAQIVIGDRFGRSADMQLSDCARLISESAGYRVAMNTPYAGGAILERHANPTNHIHAIQIEVDRQLYLDAAFRETGKGLYKIQRLIAQIAHELAIVYPLSDVAQAAE